VPRKDQEGAFAAAGPTSCRSAKLALAMCAKLAEPKPEAPFDDRRRLVRGGKNPSTSALPQRNAGSQVHEQGGRGGIADAHLPEADHGRLLIGRELRRPLVDEPASPPHPLDELLVGHRGTVKKTARSPGDLGMHDRQVSGKREIDPGIDDAQPEAVLATEHVDGRAAAHEVEHHLRGHLGRIRADSGASNAVIGRTNEDRRPAHHGGEGALNLPESAGQTFEIAQGAERLGLAIDDPLQRAAHFPIRSGNGRRTPMCDHEHLLGMECSSCATRPNRATRCPQVSPDTCRSLWPAAAPCMLYVSPSWPSELRERAGRSPDPGFSTTTGTNSTHQTFPSGEMASSKGLTRYFWLRPLTL
jgi:hypothetical protein